MWLFKIMSTLFGILMALYVISVCLLQLWKSPKAAMKCKLYMTGPFVEVKLWDYVVD